ncbi:MAG TPA: glycosyl transferase family 1 [Desulfobacteraceae bacterium]|nr:glycosyl transferase family 1 [Desulfobacteraceae bacterium]
MNICMFTNTYLPHVGGVARSVNTFARDLRKKGHRVRIIAPEFPGWQDHDLNEPDIVRVPALTEFNGSGFSVRIPVPFYLDEAVDDFAPQVIHSHHPYLLGDAAIRAARRRRLPLVFTHHTLYEAYAHHIKMDFDSFRQFAARLSTRYANLCDRVVAPSRSIARMLSNRGVETKIAPVPTGIDIAFFASGDGETFRRRHGIAKEAPVLGHVGRLAPEKNLKFLTRAALSAVNQIPESVFLVVGEGPDRGTVRNIFKEAGAADRLKLPGELSGQDLSDAYQAMDLFAFSSLTETQGMVLAEAMAAGTPVAALNAPGVREVVDHGANGVLLHPDTDEKGVAQVLAELLSNPQTRSRMGAEALKTAREYSREASVDKLIRLYRDVDPGRNGRTLDYGDDIAPWETLMLGLQTEWDLLTQKTSTLVDTIQTHGQP